ncbi:hypothetical protein ACTFIZ_007984 [Dictyostelium cf. discoideum]
MSIMYDTPASLNNEPSLIKKLNNAKDHMELFPAQHHSGKTIVVVMDFSQVQTQGDFRQTLYIRSYRYNHDQPNDFTPETHVYVSDKGVKNYIRFVIGTVSQWLIKDSGVYNATTKKLNVNNMIFWTDGCGKHFKMATNMMFFAEIKKCFKDVNLSYNFFASYHGFNCCDSAAAYSKRTLNVYQRNNDIMIKTTDIIIKTLNEQTSQNAFKNNLVSQKLKVKSIKGIKSFHKICFNEEGFKTYLCSTPGQPVHKYFKYDEIGESDLCDIMYRDQYAKLSTVFNPTHLN